MIRSILSFLLIGLCISLTGCGKGSGSSMCRNGKCWDSPGAINNTVRAAVARGEPVPSGYNPDGTKLKGLGTLNRRRKGDFYLDEGDEA